MDFKEIQFGCLSNFRGCKRHTAFTIDIFIYCLSKAVFYYFFNRQKLLDLYLCFIFAKKTDYAILLTSKIFWVTIVNVLLQIAENKIQVCNVM